MIVCIWWVEEKTLLLLCHKIEFKFLVTLSGYVKNRDFHCIKKFLGSLKQLFTVTATIISSHKKDK